MDPRQVIVRPVVSEKSYALMGEGKYTFRVHDRAHKLQIAQAVEEIFERQRAGGPHLQGEVQAEAARAALGPLTLLEEGRRPARPRRTDRAVRGRGGGGLAMANRKTSPTSPGRRFGTYPMREELTTEEPNKRLTKGKGSSGGRNSKGRGHRAPSRRRRQSGATARSTSSAPRTGSPPVSPPSSTTPTARRASRCSTTPTARSGTSSPPRGCGSAPRSSPGRVPTSRRATRCPWRRSRPAPWSTTSS